MSDSSIRTKPSIDEPSNMIAPSSAAANWRSGISTFLMTPRMSVNWRRMNLTFMRSASSRIFAFFSAAAGSMTGVVRSATVGTPNPAGPGQDAGRQPRRANRRARPSSDRSCWPSRLIGRAHPAVHARRHLMRFARLIAAAVVVVAVVAGGVFMLSRRGQRAGKASRHRLARSRPRGVRRRRIADRRLGARRRSGRRHPREAAPARRAAVVEEVRSDGAGRQSRPQVGRRHRRLRWRARAERPSARTAGGRDAAGRTVKVAVQRGGAALDLDVTPERRPARAPRRTPVAGRDRRRRSPDFAKGRARHAAPLAGHGVQLRGPRRTCEAGVDARPGPPRRAGAGAARTSSRPTSG